MSVRPSVQLRRSTACMPSMLMSRTCLKVTLSLVAPPLGAAASPAEVESKKTEPVKQANAFRNVLNIFLSDPLRVNLTSSRLECSNKHTSRRKGAVPERVFLARLGMPMPEHLQDA